MARTKTKSEPQVKDHYWTIKDGDTEIAMIYTSTTKKLKTKIEPMATYHNKGKHVASQYSINVTDNKFKNVLSELGLTEKDRVKETRKKRS